MVAITLLPECFHGAAVILCKTKSFYLFLKPTILGVKLHVKMTKKMLGQCWYTVNMYQAIFFED